MNTVGNRMTTALDWPDDAHRWNRALRGAFRKGALARQEGDPRSFCPYTDQRKPGGGLSWSRSFISAWDDGWHYADQRLPQAATEAA